MGRSPNKSAGATSSGPSVKLQHGELAGKGLQTEDDIASVLIDRKAHGESYTYLGCDTLIALQPSVEKDEQSNLYADETIESVSTLPPHVFQLAGRVHQHLHRDDEDQTVMLLGQSGSGKTETAKLVIQQLVKLTPEKRSRVTKLIGTVSAILDVFGQASGRSLFGCYQELQYKQKQLIGLKVLHYNLNTSHLTSSREANRNFDVFYNLVAGATSEERSGWHLDEAFVYLAPSTSNRTKTTLSPAYAARFTALREELKAVGISKSKQELVFRILAGILHLGNIAFADDDTGTQGEAATIRHVDELDIAADLLGVSSKDLEFTLTYKSTTINGALCTQFLNADGSRQQRDALARSMYKLVFEWIVEKMNARLCADDAEHYIGVVDMPGMVTPMVDTLDGLLTNYIQEKLVDLFRKHTAIEPAERLASQGLHQPNLTPIPEHVLETHVIPMLNTESKQSTPSDLSLMKNLSSKQGLMISGGANFMIQHSSGTTEYRLSDFTSRNVIAVSPDHISLFAGSGVNPPSSNALLKKLFSSHVAAQGAAKGEGFSSSTLRRQPSRRLRFNPIDSKTLADDLAKDLDELFGAIDETRPWYVACIGDVADTKKVKSQLLALSIPELANARAEGSFNTSLPFMDFLARYGQVGGLSVESQNKPVRIRCEEITAVFPDYSTLVGTTRVFISESVWQELEQRLETLQSAGSPKRSIKENILDYESQADLSDHDDLESVAPYTARSPVSPAATARSSHLSNELGTTPSRILPSIVNIVEDKRNFVVEDDEPARTSGARRLWVCMTWSLTCCIPSFILSCAGMKRADVRMAGREKIAICIIIFFCCCALLFFIIGFGRVICPRQPILTAQELASYKDPKDVWVSAYGRVYQINDLVKNHATSYNVQNYQFASYLGQDVSNLFYKVPLWNMYCPGIPQPQAGWDNVASRPSSGYAHNGLDSNNQTKLYMEYMNRYVKYRLGYDVEFIAEKASQSVRYIIIYDNVYDVSSYYNAANHPFGINGYAESIFNSKFGQDASSAWNDFRKSNATLAAQQMNCMNNMFYIGAVDHRNDFLCQFSNYILLASTVLLMSVIGFKFLAALQCGSTRDPEDLDKFVIIQVPCYTESNESLSRTFESVAATKYDDKRKLLFVICDGMIVGSGNNAPTPQIVLEILGVDQTIDPPALEFESIGEGNKQLNYAKVYSGLYENNGRSLPFLVVVKVGKPTERQKPGNRGKRDSQLILMRFLSRVHFGAPLNPMEIEIFHQIKNVIGINPSFYEFLLMVDADTEVFPDSINRLIAAMVHDSKIMGLCGETLLSNEKDSVITMIQVYEYFISHHLAKQFESLFGSVTCLPGCFCMYRIRTPTKNVPLLISPALIKDYSENRVDTLHMKNLLLLGEDRYLTTLAMKHFPRLKLSFTPDAICRTNGPDTWNVLKSQRRRWINSTVHNLVELVTLPQLCGFCCFSMRFVVFLDLFSTVLQPATIIYVGYLIYSIAFSGDQLPLISLVLIAAINGLQVVIFLLKQQWSQIIWMVIYILALPIFTFYLPVYAFLRQDDFNWGSTRIAVGESGKTKAYLADVEPFDRSSIPLKKWNEVEDEVSKKAVVAQKRNADAFSKAESVGEPVVYAASSYGGSQYVPPMFAMNNGAGAATSYAGSVYSQPKRLPQPSLMMANAPSVMMANSPRPVSQPIFRPRSEALSAIPSSPRLLDAPSSPSPIPSDEAIKHEVMEVLANSDLMTTTKKQVREDVSRILKVDLDAMGKKAFVNAIIDEYLTA
ncbi:chitin synthase [Synchytrium microbalum]|uniref:chitin synthase n=1 Tax=Synchytrium microbalum TaxID=1806994 RepID=A0A507C2K6_9FUNG|nr:chitin synthase [Synchytrium microbalum]TPX33598.1 chitin synthase [Synchytrium microbalum]